LIHKRWLNLTDSLVPIQQFKVYPVATFVTDCDLEGTWEQI